MKADPRLLATRTWGSTGDPCAVLLHGFMGSSMDWEELAAIVPGGLYLVGADLPGHGASGVEGGVVTMRSIVRRLEATLDALRIGSAGIIGYSLGGRIAMHYALLHPERCQRLLLESASPGLRSDSDRAMRTAADERWADRLEAGVDETLVRDWYAQPVFHSLQRRPDLVRQLVSKRLRADGRALAAVLRGAGAGRQRSLWADLRKLRMPVLAVAGALDPKYAETVRGIASAVPEGRAVVVPDAGHNVHLEQPQAFAKLVSGFFEVSSARPSD